MLEELLAKAEGKTLEFEQEFFFDELPELDATQEDLDLELAAKLFTKAKKKFTLKAAQSLGILVKHQGKLFPSHGGILLFGKEPTAFFPEGYVRLARFAGTTRSEVIDHAEYQGPLVTALDPILAFIRRNTRMGARFTEKYREDIPEYPPEVVREAFINALVHADYAIRSSAIMIAIFDDRIEIQNPGILPLGMDLETALEGVSQLRNKVFGRVCLALHLIEQWGSGLRRMVDICTSLGIQPPKFEELGNTFRVTLYSRGSAVESREASWNEPVITHLVRKKKMSAKEAQALWNVSARTTSKRLSEMIREGRIVEVSTGPFDPHKFFVRPK